MNTPRDPASELEQLLMALVDGELSPVQQQHLSALLRDDPDLQTKYRDYLLLDAMLRWEQPDAAITTPARRKAVSNLRVWLGLAVAVAACVILAIGIWTLRPAVKNVPKEVAAVEPEDSSVALLIEAPGAVWESSEPPRVGVPLSPGRLQLKSGYAQIQFYSGATVILEGPADFWLTSRTAAYCAGGKLRANVPAQAEGFRIGTPTVDVVDRGTEFGLRVEKDDKAEVHVFQGKVDMYGPNDAEQAPPHTELRTGQGVRLDGPTAARSIDTDPTAFPTAEAVSRQSREALRKRREEWTATLAQLRQDPSLLVQYTFEPDAILRNQAHGDERPHDGAIVGCTWGPGRWPGKQGLEFKRVSDRVRLHVPGEFQSLTLAAWVRADRLPNINNALLLSDGWEPGGVHWQIGEGGKLVLGIQGKPKGKGANYHAYDVFTPDRFGQWTHLAVVYDRDAGQVTHYVDGEPASRTPLIFDIPLRIEKAELGNWNVATHRNNNPVRHFTGCMDEFLLFSRALTDAEVGRIYAAGRPPA
jgi:ferric-dicitrate binding protein FerR (iron transport regulator)